MVRREFVFFANESDDEADDNILLPFILLVLVLLVNVKTVLLVHFPRLAALSVDPAKPGCTRTKWVQRLYA